MDSNFVSILTLAFAFQLLIGAFSTMAGIQKVILQSVFEEDSSFNSDGFIALALIYVFFGVSNFMAPSIVGAFGPKRTLVGASVFYGAYVASLIYPKAWLIYLTSTLLGLAAGCLWVANGVYFTKCCTEATINRNMGIYWAIQSSGMVIGNAFIFWKFQGVAHLDSQMRFWVISVITGVSALATLTLCFLGNPSKDSKMGGDGILSTISRSFKLLSDKHMLLLIPPSIYAGFEGAAFSGIYPAAVGFTEGFGPDAKKYMGLVGILTGVGTMLAGLIFGVIGSKVFKSSRFVGVLVAGVSHLIVCGLIYANLGNSSTSGPTQEESMITPPSVLIGMGCAFLLGLADGCLMPQVCAAVAAIWKEDPRASYALFRFFTSGTSAIVFVFGTVTGLHNLLFALGATAVIGTGCYCWNEKLIGKKEEKIKKVVAVSKITQSFKDKQMISIEEKSKI